MTRAALLFGLLLSFGSVPAHAAELAEGEPADAFDLETVVDGLAEPTDVAILPDGRVVVTQRLGDITIVLPDGGQIWNHIDVVAEAGHQGLLGVVADPNFATNDYLYFYASLGDADNRHKVVRIPLNENNELGELTYIIEYGLFGPKNHEGGGLIIDGNHLYVSVGDAGFNRTPPDNRLATCLNWPNGKILRVNLDGSIPEDNPLTDVELATGCTWWDQPLELYPPDTRVYAWGLRNPFRFSVDSKTGLLWVGDVGESAREKIAVGGRGDHFGWPYREGSVEYEEDWHPEDTCEGVTPARECVPVAHEYAHESGNDCVIGGLILDACGWPEEWKSRYIFGDHGSGRVWTLDVNESRTGVKQDSLRAFAYDGDEPSRRFGGVASFRMGPDHALYIVEDLTGTVQRVRPKTATDEVCPLPTTLASGGTSGASENIAPASAEDAGCGCRAGGAPRTPLGIALVTALGLGLATRRRHRREA